MNAKSESTSDAPKGKPVASFIVRVYLRNGDPATVPTIDALTAEIEDGLSEAFGFDVNATGERVDQ